ncbi:unnamed protein product [Urochloa humidicola]
MSQGDSQEDNMEDLVTNGSPPQDDNNDNNDSNHSPKNQLMDITTEIELHSKPISTTEGQGKQKLSKSSPIIDNLEQGSQESSLLSPEKLSTKELQIPEGKIIVHDQEGPYLMDKEKWPVLKLPEELSTKEKFSGKKILQEEDLMDNTSNYGFEGITDEEDNQGWIQAKGGKKNHNSSKKRKKPVVASRHSTRVVRDGIPIALKAMVRTRDKNELRKEMETFAEDGGQ